MELDAPGSLFLLHPQHPESRRQEWERAECRGWSEHVCATPVDHFHHQMTSTGCSWCISGRGRGVISPFDRWENRDENKMRSERSRARNRHNGMLENQGLCYVLMYREQGSPEKLCRAPKATQLINGGCGQLASTLLSSEPFLLQQHSAETYLAVLACWRRACFQ